MWYVYILEEVDKAGSCYVGFTEDLRKRIADHKSGNTRSTQGRRWLLKVYVAFHNEKVARNFEKYLKSGSGRSFCKKHFELT